MIVNGVGYGTPQAAASANATAIGATPGYFQLPISTNTIIMLVVLVILVAGFILYRRHLKNKYA